MGFGVYYMFHAIRRGFSKAMMLAGTATFGVVFGRIPRRSSTDQDAGKIVSLAQPVFRSATSESHGVHLVCHPRERRDSSGTGTDPDV